MRSVPVISALLYRKHNNTTEIFLQTRWKPEVSPNYTGLLEIPAGVIEAYENVYDALRREVYEECGLTIIKIIDDMQWEVISPREGDRSFIFRPYLCQHVLETRDGLPWTGYVFLCEASWEPVMQTSEAKDPQWVSIDELRKLVKEQPELFFSLQLPALQYFCDNFVAE